MREEGTVMREEGCGMREMKEEGGVSEERGGVREVRKVAPRVSGRNGILRAAGLNSTPA